MKKYEKLEKEIELARKKNISWESIDRQLCLKLGANIELRKHFNISQPNEIDKVINYMKAKEYK